MTGSLVTVRPYLRVIATSDGDPATVLNSADANGTAHWKAGKDFRLYVQGVTAGDTPTVTQNYLPGGLNLKVAMLAPTVATTQAQPLAGNPGVFTVKARNGGNAAVITAGDAGGTGDMNAMLQLAALYSNGSMSNDGAAPYALANYSEVGVLSITATDGDYYGQSISSNTAIVGRFTPDHFSVAFLVEPALRNGTGDWSAIFTYMNQPFTFATQPVLQVTALNKDGGITKNYTGSFWKLTGAKILPAYTDLAKIAGDFESTAVAAKTGGLAIVDGTGGIGTITINDTFTYKRRSGFQKPFAAQVKVGLQSLQSDGVTWGKTLADSDAVCHDNAADGVCDEIASSTASGADIRFGCINLDEAAGAVGTDLVQRVYMEYINSNGKRALNTDDSSTRLVPALIDLSSSLADPGPGVVTIEVATGISTQVSVAGDTFNHGENALIFSKIDTAGYIDSTLAVKDVVGYEFARCDWDGDGVHDDNPPKKRSSFGVYKGQSNVKKGRIFVREVYDSGAAEEENLNK
ncbi:MAG: hypothetical protein EPN21_02595 [Methylococcaceae bacterium]|nr:MAG: hypothetical protein EPN21_02595 [Methylococcaceae bacterium]